VPFFDAMAPVGDPRAVGVDQIVRVRETRAEE